MERREERKEKCLYLSERRERRERKEETASEESGDRKRRDRRREKREEKKENIPCPIKRSIRCSGQTFFTKLL